MRNEKITYEEIFKKLNIQRWCCKTILLTHVNFTDKISQYTDKYLKNVEIHHKTNLPFVQLYRTI